MNGAGEQLLAGAALAMKENGGGRRRHLLYLGGDLLERAALADDPGQAELVRELFPQEDVLGGDTIGIERPLDEHEQVLRIERFGQEVIGPLLYGLDRGF